MPPSAISVGDILLLSHVASRQSFQLLVNSSRTSVDHSARNVLLSVSQGLDILVERLESTAELSEDDSQAVVDGANAVIKHAGAILDVTGLWMWRRHNVVEREASVVNAIGIILVGIVDVLLDVLQTIVKALEHKPIPAFSFPPYGAAHAHNGEGMAEPEEVLSILKKLKVRLEKCASPAAKYPTLESAKSSQYALTEDSASIQDPPPFSIRRREDSDGNMTIITDSPSPQDEDASSIALSQYSIETGQESKSHPFNGTPLLSQEDWDSDDSEEMSPREMERSLSSKASESIASSSRLSVDDASLYSQDPNPHRHCQFCTTLRPTESSLDVSTLDLNDAASMIERISMDSCCAESAVARAEAAVKLEGNDEYLRRTIFQDFANRGLRERFSVVSGLAEIAPGSQFRRYSTASVSTDSLSIKSGRKSVRFSTDESREEINTSSAATKSSQTSLSSQDVEALQKAKGSRPKTQNRNKPLPALKQEPAQPMAVLLEDEPRRSSSKHISFQGVPRDRRSISSIISHEQRMMFETELLKKARVICSVQGMSVSYARIGASGDYETTPAMSKCKFLLIESLARDEDEPVKSIWAFSEDQSVRMEQRLPASADVIPYNAWGSNCKILIKIPSLLRFHGHKYRDHAVDEIQAGWVTYEVEDDEQSDEFQGAFLDKELLLTARTMKTSRIFDGLAATFSVQERICGLENLRLWRDNESNGVQFMIHYMPSFQSGFLRFYVNSRTHPIQITPDADRGVKITGLFVPLQLPEDGKAAKSNIKNSKSKAKKAELKKLLTGVKIEFSSVEDKKAFLHVVNEAKMLPFSD